jgi:hydrogenase maturation protease
VKTEEQTAPFENGPMERRPVVVLGLGNPLMADEGIGVHLVERLRAAAADYPSVDFVDAGTGGWSILHQIQGRRKAVLIDCAFLGEPAGAIRRFVPEEVRSTKTLAHQSLHEADLWQILGGVRQLGQGPDEIVIFGIQPERVVPEMGLSRALRDRMDVYASMILQEAGA